MLKHQYESTTSRLTITLSEARYKTLKGAFVQRDKTMGELIDESLDFYGTESRVQAQDLDRRARSNGKLDEEQAIAVAPESVRSVRRKP